MRSSDTVTQWVQGSGPGESLPRETEARGDSATASRRGKTTVVLLILLLAVYAAVYGWILIDTGFMPYVMDNNESFSVLVHASNMYHFSFWKTFGLTDEAYGSNPDAHPFIHTHQGNMPRLFGFLIYVLGARSIESQITVTTATIGTLSVILMYLFFTKLAGPVFAFICSTLLITDYVNFLQWHVVTYRVWYTFLFFLILLSVHGMSGPHRRRWKWAMAGAFLLLFYSELVFAGFMTLFSVLYTLVVHRRKLSVAREIITVQFIAASTALAILFLQLSLVFGPSVVAQDFRWTFFSRNDSGGLAIERMREFFRANNIVYWDNIFDVTSLKNHVQLIRSQTHFNFQVYTPILTLISVTLLAAWLLAHWRFGARAARRLGGAISYPALRACWFLVLIALAPWSLALWLQSGRYLSTGAILGAAAAAVLGCVLLRHGPAAAWRLSRFRSEDPKRTDRAIRLAGVVCSLFLLLQMGTALAYHPILAGSSALLFATRAFYVLVMLGMFALALRMGLMTRLAWVTRGVISFASAMDERAELRRSAVTSVAMLVVVVLLLRAGLGTRIQISPWLVLYLILAIAFVVLFCYWRVWTGPFLRLGPYLSGLWSSTQTPDAVRVSAMIAAGFLIPFALPMLDVRVENALIFRSYTVPYFGLLTVYAAVCLAMVRCALNPARAFLWLQKMNFGGALTVPSAPEYFPAEGNANKAQVPGVMGGAGEQWERRFCAAVKAAVVFLLLFYVLALIVEGQNVFGTAPPLSASIWAFPSHALLVLFMAAAGTLAAARLGGHGWIEFDRLPPRLVAALAIYLFAIGNFIQHHWEWYAQPYSAVWMEPVKFPDLNLISKLAVLLAVALGLWMVLVGRRRVLYRASIEELRRIGVFFLLGEFAYVVIYLLSPGYVLTGYQWRHAPFAVFFTCVIPAMSVYILFLVTRRAWKGSQNDDASEIVDLRSEFDRLLPRLTGATAATVAMFLCVYWAIVQVTYVHLLPPDQFSFLKSLSKPPYQGKSFAVTTYAAPVAFMTGAWAYFDPLMTTGWKPTARGDEMPRDSRYLWLADRWKNESYEKPDYYACMIGQNLPKVAARLKNPDAPAPGCSIQGLVSNVTQGNTPAINYQLVGAEGGKSDSWAIVKLDYEFPPYLEQLGPDVRAGVNLSLGKAREHTLRPRVEYGFRHLGGAPEGNSLLELYAAEDSACDTQPSEWQRIYRGPPDHVLPLPMDFTGRLQAFVTPRTAHKEGWRFHSPVVRISEGDLSSRECPAETPAPPSGLHAVRIDETTIELNWRRSPGMVHYRVDMARGDGPMQTIAQLSTNPGVFTIGAVPAGLPYRLRVAACDAGTGACSWPTPSVTGEKLQGFAPEPVTEIHAYRLSAQTAYLEWSPAPYARDYVLEMRLKGGEFEEVDRVDQRSSREWIDNLQPQSEYSVRVRACRQNDCAEYSPEVPIGRNATLLPPARFRVTRRDPAAAVLSWEAGELVDLYRLDMATGQAGEFVQIGTASRRSEYTVGDLGPGTSYRFRIRSCLHAQGPCSSYSPIVVSVPGQ